MGPYGVPSAGGGPVTARCPKCGALPVVHESMVCEGFYLMCHKCYTYQTEVYPTEAEALAEWDSEGKE